MRSTNQNNLLVPVPSYEVVQSTRKSKIVCVRKGVEPIGENGKLWRLICDMFAMFEKGRLQRTVPPTTRAGTLYKKDRVFGRAVPPTTLAGTTSKKGRLVKSAVPTSPLAGPNIEKKRLIESVVPPTPPAGTNIEKERLLRSAVPPSTLAGTMI